MASFDPQHSQPKRLPVLNDGPAPAPKTGSLRSPFIPTSRAEMLSRGWDAVDIVFISGDAYVDHSSFACALIARVLESRGFRVGMIPQPDWRSVDPFREFGRPRLMF